MTDISARQTFTTAGNTRLSDNPGSADTPESGRYIEAPGLTRPTGLLADRRNCVTMGRRQARPRGRENYPRQTNHIRAIRPPPGSPRVEFGASFAPSPALLRRFFGASFVPARAPLSAPTDLPLHTPHSTHCPCESGPHQLFASGAADTAPAACSTQPAVHFATFSGGPQPKPHDR